MSSLIRKITQGLDFCFEKTSLKQNIPFKRTVSSLISLCKLRWLTRDNNQGQHLCPYFPEWGSYLSSIDVHAFCVKQSLEVSGSKWKLVTAAPCHLALDLSLTKLIKKYLLEDLNAFVWIHVFTKKMSENVWQYFLRRSYDLSVFYFFSDIFLMLEILASIVLLKVYTI